MKKIIMTLIMAAFLFTGTSCVVNETAVRHDNVEYVKVSDSMTVVNGIAHVSFDTVDHYSYRDMRDDLLYMKAHGIREMQLTLFNGGGSVFHMFSVYDMLRSAIDQGLVLHTHGQNIVASAAVPIFLLGETRTMQEHGYIMLHSHSSKQREVLPESFNKMTREWTEAYINILLDRTTMCREEINLYLGNDKNPKYDQLWLNHDEAKEKGFLTE